MKKLRLVTDYFCYPIFHDDGASTGEYGDIDPHTLPISKELANDLIEWQGWFERGLDMDNPGNSVDMSFAEKELFKKQGYSLLERLKSELGSEYSVSWR